ncbi:MAG: MAPEG family protein [Gammaproteobacteria bacterium]|nr:MAPEG family protein [Gammaproteobacteria bacterium]
MTIELQYLTYVALFTTLMWPPYILNGIAVRGLTDAVGYPQNPQPLDAWASRLKAAHYNAVENLVVFASLVLVAHVIGVSNPVTVLAVKAYFFARIVHALVYSAAVPWLRTLSFAVSWLALIALAVQILSD